MESYVRFVEGFSTLANIHYLKCLYNAKSTKQQLDIAVEAMVKATEAGSGFEKYETLIAALAEIEALKQLEG